jgi:hypothetical protein
MSDDEDLDKNTLIEKLRERRNEYETSQLRTEAAVKNTRLAHIKQRIRNLEKELLDAMAGGKATVERVAIEGSIYLTIAILAVYGGIGMARLSLETFLPVSQISSAVQNALAAVFAVGTVAAIHFSIPVSDNGKTRVPALLKLATLLSFLVGLICFGLIRGKLGGSWNASLEALKTAGGSSKLLGEIALVAFGLGVDLIGGIAGAFAWARLGDSLPILWIYSKIERLTKTSDVLEEQVAAINAVLLKTVSPAVQPGLAKAAAAGKPHAVEAVRDAGAQVR